MNNKLTPEEDAIGDPVEDSDEIDDTLPADLWFRGRFVILSEVEGSRRKQPGLS